MEERKLKNVCSEKIKKKNMVKGRAEGENRMKKRKKEKIEIRDDKVHVLAWPPIFISIPVEF